MTRTTRILMPFAAVAALALAAAVPAGLRGTGPNSTSIPTTGQSLTIQITDPVNYSPLLMPPASMDVTGVCAIGEMPPGSFNVLYVVDVSGSTDADYMLDPANAMSYVDADCDGFGSFAVPDLGDDMNGDREPGETLDGEISGVLALNASLAEVPDVRVGVVAFASGALAADVDPARPNSGRIRQVFTTPLADRDFNGVVDVEEVLRSLRSEHARGGSIGEFTRVRQSVLGNNTGFPAALAVVNDTMALFPADGRRVVFYLSDGYSNVGGRCIDGACEAALDATVSAGMIVNTVGVGLASDPEDLAYVAARTGGTFVQVDDPSELSTVLPGLNPAGIDHVEIDGAVMPVDPLGTFTTVVECTEPGTMIVTATCVADDPDATRTSADVTLECMELPEVCDDFVDNDGDGLIDCLDPDCPCPGIGKDPSVIRFYKCKPGRDYVSIHGSIPLCDGDALTTEPLGLLLTNVHGVVYKAELAPGLLKRVGTHRWLYYDRNAARAHAGVELLEVRYYPHEGIYTFAFKAYGDLAPVATEALMAIQLKVGSEMFVLESVWKRRSYGWKLELPKGSTPPAPCVPGS